MNEVTKTTDNAILDEMKSQSPTNFVPSLKITYGVSPHVGEDGSKVGDFFLDGTNLGTKIKCLSLGYRFQVMALDEKSGDFLESIILTKDKAPEVNFKDRKEYKEFIKVHQKDDVVDGFDELLYLPETNQFGILFFKKKLAKSAAPTLDLSNKGNFVTLETVKQEYKKYSWYTLNVEGTKEKAELPQNAEEMLNLYYSQVEEVIDEPQLSDPSTTRER